MAKSKLQNSANDLPLKVFQAMTEIDKQGCPKKD